MFRATMKNWIDSKIKIAQIITIQCGGPSQSKPISRSTRPSHVSSAKANTMERYSASVLDFAIVGCFFSLQEKQLGPKKVQNPKVDQRVRGQPTSE